MTQQAGRETEHEVTVAAPAPEVYRLIAEVENWPLMFPPSVHVDYAERGEHAERIRIWADVNGEAKQWTSRRVLDAGALRIEFRQEVSAPPVAAMGGTWIVEPAGDAVSRVRLLHHFRAVGDDPAKLDWIGQAVDRNSRSELTALKSTAERAPEDAELSLSFEDTVRVAGPVRRAYAFINEAQHWADRLPHVVGVSLTEDTPGLQVLNMETRTKDGSAHTTESVRVCFPDDRIVYKQTRLPALLSLHTGCWKFAETDGVTVVTSRHTAVIDAAAIVPVLGRGAGVPEARAFVRDALSGNSLATLGHAKEYAEARG